MDGLGFGFGFLNNVRSKESTVGLFSGKFLDVNAPLLTVDSCDLSFSVLECSSHDLHGVTLADWD